MVNLGKGSILPVAMLGACGCLVAAQACAGDAMARLAAQAARGNANAQGSTPVRVPVVHLDLAPPGGSQVREISRAGMGSFPSAARLTGVTTGNELSAAFSAVSNEPRPRSKVEQLARNFHREGLPVAKLFQSNDSLIHIGLSPKGKPGLWLVKKLH